MFSQNQFSSLLKIAINNDLNSNKWESESSCKKKNCCKKYKKKGVSCKSCPKF